MPEENFKFPPLPWTHEALGEERYCQVAVQLGFFNPKAETPDYRPDLDPTPFLDKIKADNPGQFRGLRAEEE
jgi:hypothetical protein